MIANVQVVLVALIAWAVLSERPDNRVLGSIPLLFFGVVLISGVIEPAPTATIRCWEWPSGWPRRWPMRSSC